MNGDPLPFLSVVELGCRYRARTLSPVEVTRALLARIARLEPRLHAFVTVTAHVAEEQASRAEAELHAGKDRGPLHGVPYVLKDVIDTAGIRTTYGARPFIDRVPDADAAVVERLRESGAVLLGKTACIELAGALGCSSAAASVSGPTMNPWDPLRWAGGSSSGAAAAVAAGLAPFAIGTETLGSILCPAAFCGLTGVRPTFGVVSRSGVMPFAYSMDKVGVLARSAEDGALGLAAIAGNGSRDAGFHPRVTRASLRGLRVGLLEQHFRFTIDPTIEIYLDGAIGALERLGARTKAIRLPDLPYVDMAEVVAESEGFDAFSDLIDGQRLGELDDPIHHRAGDKPTGPRATDYVRAMRLRTKLSQELELLFADHDVILSLNSPILAPLLDRPLPEEGGDLMRLAGNLAGLPAIAVPMGFAPPGKLPVSFQLVGRPYSEGRLLSIAAAYQRVSGWHREHPAES